MLQVFVYTALASAVFGVIVGFNEASFWTGFWAYIVCGIIMMPLSGLLFTPQFRVEDEE